MRTLAVFGCLLMTGCATRTTQTATDAGMARCVPAGAQALAGLDLDRLGAVSEAIRNRLGAPEGTRSLLVAMTGTEVLVIARGNFAQAPAGAVMITADLAVVGTADAMAAAAGQYRSGAVPVSALLTHVGTAPLWAVVQGGISLPLSGNLANFNRFLRSTEYTTLAVHPGETYSIDITGVCRSVDSAQLLERTMRGLLSIAQAAKGNAETLSGIHIGMEDRMVRVSLTAERATVEGLLR